MPAGGFVDDDFYRAPITLVVEDPATRAFLSALWADPDITYRQGAGHEGVAALVNNAPRKGGRVIVGLVDLDSSAKNRDRWADPALSLLRLDRHEIENYFLDWGILGRLSGKRTPAEIEAEARSYAGAMIWWMASKRVLRQIRVDFLSNFVGDPLAPRDPLDQGNLEHAVAHIHRHPFWKNNGKAQKQWTEIEIRNRVRQEGATYEGDLASGRWLETFSGKELLRYLRSYAGLDEKSKNGTAAERDEDLGRKIALRMKAQNTIPADFLELRRALRLRAGLTP